MRPLVDMGETFQDISRRSGLLRTLFLFFVLAIALLARGMTNEALAQACEQGTFSQCHAEGVKQMETKSYPAALGLFVRGCENADQTSCEAIAKLVVERPILRRNRAARKTLKAACERKVGPACTQHGVLKLSRRNSDIRRARQDFQKGCELGDGSGCRRLGEMVEATELAVAQQSYVKACELGDDASCGHSGRLLAATDAAAAVPLLIRGCDVLNAKACGALGRLHELGGFAGSDIKEAESAYQRACDGGDTVSCGRLGSILFRRGDSKEAEPRLRTACKAKQAIHCTELGELLSTQSDTKSARRFFTQARVANQRSCRQGNGAACQNVSQDYQLGRGVRTSSAQADRWLERGCIAGIADKNATPVVG
ncbi:MAG: sel1 repeat family protein, partial [Kofleriaceae bacterium]|nr:sel1 repeat family protein [Kofleriaceae bacterium]